MCCEKGRGLWWGPGLRVGWVWEDVPGGQGTGSVCKEGSHWMNKKGGERARRALGRVNST